MSAEQRLQLIRLWIFIMHSFMQSWPPLGALRFP